MNKAFILIGMAWFAGASGAKTVKPLHAKCFKPDTAQIWERIYCYSTTGADDEASEVFQACYKKIQKDPSLSKKRCQRIVWLKEKACHDDPSTGHTRKACLTDKDYLKKIENNPPYIGS